jgi:hypothetical protein
MELLNVLKVTPPSYEEFTYKFECEGFRDGLEYSIRIYEDGGYSLHDCDGFQMDESSDDYHGFDYKFTIQILESHGLV